MLSNLVEKIWRWVCGLFHPTATDRQERVDPPQESAPRKENKTNDNGEAPPDPQTTDEPNGGKTPTEHPKTKEPHRPDDEPETRPPVQMPGKRRKPRTLGPTNKDRKNSRPEFVSKPELICRKPAGSWRWELLLVWDDECGVEQARQDGESLELSDGKCHLAAFRGNLSIKCSNRDPEEIRLFDGAPLVFKLSNDWTGDGRKVRGVTKGHFIVFAPAEWTREGHVRVEPEACTDEDFTAHYFYRDASTSLDDAGTFKEYRNALTTAGFDLVGEDLFDDSEYGSLFVGNAPVLRTPKGIVWARVGEEARNGWKGQNFKPDKRSLEQALEGRQGRFFVRVYGGESQLVDSDEFRYLRDLCEIRVNGEPYTEQMLLLPPYIRTTVDFVGTGDIVVEPVLLVDEVHAEVNPRGAVIIKRHPDADFLRCELEAGGGRTGCAIRLPRIWWRLEQGGEERDYWSDTPLEMTRKQFREHADADAVIRLRVPRRIKSIATGFDDEVSRTFRGNRIPTEEKAEFRVTLADFVDYTQIDQRLAEDTSFRVRCGHKSLNLIRVLADPLATVTSFSCEPATIDPGEHATLRWVTRDAEEVKITVDPEIGVVEPSGTAAVAPKTTTTYTLRFTAPGMDDAKGAVTVIIRPPTPMQKPVPRVRKACGGWRRGKGFSPSELRAADLTPCGVKSKSIPMDRRRRSKHPGNVDTLLQESLDD